ncbi:hypothetical protein JYU14_04890 [Simkania negevensis]|uniref:Uncharacterized protein n=1 Tax=Simkania negevensis TaxID=83561 RepID=A0ABS3ARP0_9BACT|nr:hypothetical protein [Simkania negevensis]
MGPRSKTSNVTKILKQWSSGGCFQEKAQLSVRKFSLQTPIAARLNGQVTANPKKKQISHLSRINIRLSNHAFVSIVLQLVSLAQKSPTRELVQSDRVEVIEDGPDKKDSEETTAAAAAPTMPPSLQEETATPAQQEGLAPAQEEDSALVPKKIETTQAKRDETRVTDTAKPGKMRILLSKIADLFKKLFFFITYPFRAIYTTLASRVTRKASVE